MKKKINNDPEPFTEAEIIQAESVVIPPDPPAPVVETPPVDPPKPDEKTAMLIPIGADGKIAARNHSELIRYCGAIALAGSVPERFNTTQKLFAAIMFVRDLGLPDTAIRQVATIHGTPSIFGDLPLALIQRSKQLHGFKEQWFDKKYDVINFENKNLDAEVWGAVCFMGREKNNVQSFAFTLDDAKTAGLYPCSNKEKPWAKYPKLMLRYRARAIAAKSMFADYVNGVSIAEYDHDEFNPSTFKDVTNSSGESKLNAKLDGIVKGESTLAVDGRGEP